MAASSDDYVFDIHDQRLIAALQCDGRLTAERAAAVLDLPARVAQRRLAALLAGGGVRVIATPPRPLLGGVMLLRIRVLRGKIGAVAAALAARDDIPLIDLSASGDQLSVVLLARPDEGHRLVFRQLPATSAVLSVDAQTVLHVYTDAGQWRLDVLSAAERRQLTPPPPAGPPRTAEPRIAEPRAAAARALGDLDRAIMARLAADARTPASAMARSTGQPESTIRRRLPALFTRGHLATQVIVDPRRLGLAVDANLRMQVLPKHLDEAGRKLAAHPAVHGALATTGPASLNVAVWLRDLDDLYRFITRDLAGLDVGHVDTVLIGDSLKRPGQGPPPARATRG